MILETRKFFEKFKKVFSTIFMFCHFNFNVKIFLKTNVFEFVVLKILSQLTKNEKWYSIIFWSRKMTTSKRNYKIEEMKMLTIVNACKKWKHYVENVKYFVRILTNHHNFFKFLIIKIFNRKKIKWWKRLFELNLFIEYRSKKNNFVDESFRRKNYEIAIKKKKIDNVSVIENFLKNVFFDIW